jgi:hypothetical protein
LTRVTYFQMDVTRSSSGTVALLGPGEHSREHDGRWRFKDEFLFEGSVMEFAM